MTMQAIFPMMPRTATKACTTPSIIMLGMVMLMVMIMLMVLDMVMVMVMFMVLDMIMVWSFSNVSQKLDLTLQTKEKTIFVVKIVEHLMVMSLSSWPWVGRGQILLMFDSDGNE